MTATTKMYHPYSGIRLICIPGGLHFRTPTINSTAAAIDAISIKDSPSNQMSAPIPGWYSVVMGGYMNQPPRGAAPKNSDPHTKIPPIRKHQYP
jgi:hypothetical protein